MSDAANLFLDQLAVWRELSFNGCEWFPRYMDYQSFPSWARETLEAHGSDSGRRYAFETLESAATHDPIWNATQRQLLTEGWFHGYLRMLWGKKILEWAPDRPTALAWMETLMNRYSLDGRDPVSYAGFAWVLGRYDRPWPGTPCLWNGQVYVVRERQAKAPDVRVFEAVQLRSASRLVLARGAEADRFTSTTPDRYVLCTTTLSAGVRGMGPAKEHHGRRNEEPHGRAG